MARSDRQRIQDMLAAIENIRSDTGDLDALSFASRPMVIRSVLYSIAMIGEAAKGLGDDSRAMEPAIRWQAIAGMRNYIVHEYFRIDTQRVWDIVAHEIDPLEAASRRLSGG